MQLILCGKHLYSYLVWLNRKKLFNESHFYPRRIIYSICLLISSSFIKSFRQLNKYLTPRVFRACSNAGAFKSDQEALYYYHTNREMPDAAIDEYTSYYGPLTMDAVLSKNKWTWIEKPWPWEVEA